MYNVFVKNPCFVSQPFETINSRFGKLNLISSHVSSHVCFTVLPFCEISYQNWQSDSVFIGRFLLINSKTSSQGNHFSMPHVLALCYLILSRLGEVLGDTCLVTVLRFVETVGKVGIVDEGCNLVLVEHAVIVKVVVKSIGR